MKPTKTIEFNKEYTKLFYQTEGVLIALFKTKLDKLSPMMLSWDTEYNENGMRKHYHVKGPDLIFLVFLGNFNIPFTTLRSYTPKKFEYYKNAMRERFELKRETPMFDDDEIDNGHQHPQTWKR